MVFESTTYYKIIHSMNLRLAIQKKGRLSEDSLQLLKKAGIAISNRNKLTATASNFPLEVLYLRDDDIPQCVAEGVADIGIIGENVLLEKNVIAHNIKSLGFGKCRLSLATRREDDYTGIEWFQGKKIATSYPNILQKHLLQKGIKADIELVSGSVEIAPSIGLADGVFDIVSTGSTLIMNGLKEVEILTKSEAVLIANPKLKDEKQAILDQLLFRIDAVKNAEDYRYILLNAPNDKIAEITKVLPGIKSPTVLPLATNNWSSLHSVVKKDDFWEITDRLRAAGAQGILVIPIESMVF